MADNQTQLIISIETILRGLDKTLRGLKQVEQQLKRTAGVATGAQTATNINRTAAATQRLQQQQQRAAISAQRLAQQQQAVTIRAQQLANAQTRAQQTTQRLAQAQERLDRVIATTSRGLNQQADNHVRAFRAIERASARTTQNILSVGNALRSVGQGLASLGATLSVTLTAPLVAAGVASVDAAVRLDSLKRGLAAIVGSADEANRQLQRLTQIAKLPGIGFEEAIQGSIRLQAVGFSALEAERNLREFANAIALTGGGRDELARVTVQLGQLAAKGKVLSQDLRPIIEAAPAVGRALLQAFGTVNADDIQDLGLSTKQFLGILTDELSRLPRAAAGAKNSFENFRDEVFRAAAAVGEVLLPPLIRLAEVLGPVIVRLADTFAKLPQPIQIAVVGATALLAALGPVVFVVGQLILGVGRLLVGFVELNAAGILPTIASLRALTTGSLSAAAAQRTLAASTALTVSVLGGVAAVIAAVVGAFAIYNAFQKDAATLSKERADQLTAEIKALEEQAKFLGGLEAGVERTADQQQRLSDIYDRLNTQAQIRVAGITDEAKRLTVLRAELEKLIQLRGQERIQQAASTAAQIADSAAQIAANDRSRDSIAARIAANNALVETLEREGRVSLETGRQLERLGITAGGDVRLAITALQAESARLVERQRELGENTKETEEELRQYLEALRALDPSHQLTARQLLTLARNMGLFRGDVESMVPVLESYIKKTDEATKSTDEFNRSLSENERQLNAAGAKADAAAKRRQTIIQSAAATARETSVDFEGALRSLREMIDAVPELRAAFRREGELTGKSLDELLRSALEKAFTGRDKDKSSTTLRNAQEQLAQALAETARASAEQQTTIERLKNERLLELNENNFRLQLISYRAYLSERARLTSANLGLEIDEQKAIVDEALAEAARFRARASRGGLPAAERTKAAAGAAAAEERAVKAQTKILELTQRQRDARAELGQLLAEAARQQEKDVRQLAIEFGELTGQVEESLNTETVERFREQLEALGRAQIDITQRLQLARLARDKDEEEELLRAQRLNQTQIDLIEGIVAQIEATNALAAAQRLVEQAKERQRLLEEQIAFEVQFRGLAEDDAIKKRLAGEQALLKSLGNSFHTIRQIVQALEARGVKPPQALIDFLKQIRVETENLGELSFAEQFAREEKKFDRLNDERLRRIADVERAVRNRTIAEAEGLLLIRRINGEYVGDLQQQVDLLKQIAAASGDANLQRQAESAAETAKDAADQLADLDKQIRSTSIDALQEGFTSFFLDLTDRSQSALEDLLNFINSVTRRINEVIAENLSRKLIESIFGGSTEAAGGGILAGIKRILGLGGGGEGAVGAAGGLAGGVAGAATQQTAATTAAATLQAGATAAAATETASAVGFATAVTTAAATFATAVAAAGAAFAAAVTASSAARSVGALSDSGIGNFATGDILPARPGGVLARVAEAGHAEAVLTTDPRHALKQARILSRFLRMTRGLQGRFPVPELASGALVTPRQAEADLLSGITRIPLNTSAVGDLRLAASGGGETRLRQVLVDQRSYRDWLTSSEGEQVVVDILYRNQPVIRTIGGGRK